MAFSYQGNNPQKTWGYGVRDGDCGDYIRFPYYGTVQFDDYPQGNLGYWSTDYLRFPFVGKNLTTNPHTLYDTIIVPTDLLVLYPAGNQQRAVVRWTVPYTATFNMAVHFKGIDNYPTSSSYTIFYNSGILATGVINGNGTDVTLNNTFSLLGGSTFDFEVGNGDGLNYVGDATGFDVTFTKVDITASKPKARVMCY